MIALTFPGGKLHTLTIAATAGNVQTNLTPGVRKRWVILSGKITIVCNGNPSNRLVIIGKQTTAGIALDPAPFNDTAFTAGQTRSIAFDSMFPGGEWKDEDFNASSAVPFGGILEGTDRINIQISGGLAGDSYSGIIRVLELGL